MASSTYENMYPDPPSFAVAARGAARTGFRRMRNAGRGAYTIVKVAGGTAVFIGDKLYKIGTAGARQLQNIHDMGAGIARGNSDRFAIGGKRFLVDAAQAVSAGFYDGSERRGKLVTKNENVRRAYNDAVKYLGGLKRKLPRSMGVQIDSVLKQLKGLPAGSMTAAEIRTLEREWRDRETVFGPLRKDLNAYKAFVNGIEKKHPGTSQARAYAETYDTLLKSISNNGHTTNVAARLKHIKNAYARNHPSTLSRAVASASSIMSPASRHAAVNSARRQVTRLMNSHGAASIRGTRSA